ncbi:MAG TPA: ABC transporter substrate-binding protein, partial [Candidatus Dormibacteraeota bacterium]|nr:ABC transporter substrate-binding protein [Candidatus Dormibacteraeota bacterium]
YVTVQLQQYANYTTLETKSLSALAAGKPPTMAQCYESWAAKYLQSKAIVDLQPYINASDGLSKQSLNDVIPTLLQDGKLNGKQYMFPFNKSDSVMFYNRQLLQQAGISSPPTTWDQFFADSKKLTADGHWGADASNSLEDDFESMVLDNGGTLLNGSRTKATFNGPAGQKALQMWVTGVKDGYIHNLGNNPNAYDDEDFGTGKAALSVDTIAGYSYKKAIVGNKFTMATAPEPAGPDGAHPQVYGTNVCVFGKASKAEQQGAFQYIKYFTSKAPQETWASQTGYLPVRTSALKALDAGYYKSHPELAVAGTQLSKGVFSPNLPVWDEAQSDISVELFNAVDGKESVKQALNTAAGEVDKLLSGSSS